MKAAVSSTVSVEQFPVPSVSSSVPMPETGTENQMAAKNIKQQSSGNGRHQQHKLRDKTEKVELVGART